MRTLRFWQDYQEVICDNEGNTEERLQWLCSDGISTFYGDTKSEAASHFGVPVGDFGDEISQAAAALGRKGGLVKSERKTAAVRANGRLGGRPRKNRDEGRAKR